MRVLLFCLGGLISLAGHAQSFDQSHSVFDQILKDTVAVDGHHSRVNYAEVIRQRAKLDAYLAQLSGVSKSEFDALLPDQQLAFLINTYNAYQLKQVVDHYPIDSIKDVGNFFSSPWSKEFFTLFGEPASLDLVEHGMIRTMFKEPRIHFAVNCASISCPPLMAEAFVADRLNAQLETATFNFLNDLDANRLEGDTLYLSKIFQWYEGDFATGVIDFVAKYRPDWVEGGTPELDYTDYDWNLNEAKN